MKKRNLTSEKILEQAFLLMEEKETVKSFTMRDLAMSLNVQVPAIYWYFKNKDELVSKMVEEVYSKINSMQVNMINKDSLVTFSINYYSMLKKFPFVVEVISGKGYHMSKEHADTCMYLLKSLQAFGISEEKSYMGMINFHSYLLGTLVNTSLKESIDSYMNKKDNMEDIEFSFKKGMEYWLTGILGESNK
ncbi:TetR/AcrR family transcriptional regulator [Vagococcus sp. JNUCC 83]